MINNLINIFKSRIKAIEILALLNDLKPIVREGFYKEELKPVIGFCEKNNLSCNLSKFKVINLDQDKVYGNKGLRVSVKDKRKGMFFIYISKDELLAYKANYAELVNDHNGFGRLLGYPECCIDFFLKYNKEREKLDNNYEEPLLQKTKQGTYNFVMNIFSREKDICLLSHFPCSLQCVKSLKIGKRNFVLIERIDKVFSKEIKNKLVGDIMYKNKIITFN